MVLFNDDLSSLKYVSSNDRIVYELRVLLNEN
jgi:hypothetical protein